VLYQKVGNRCAFTLKIPGLDVSEDILLHTLVKKGFEVVDVDMIKTTRNLTGQSKYRKGALLSKAPSVVDCSGLIKWLYGLRGIWLPRNLFLWQKLGQGNFEFSTKSRTFPITLEDSVDGDIVFTTDAEAIGGIGHVGLGTGQKTMIHATNYVGVEEVSFEELMKERLICAIRRLIPVGPPTVTLLLPEKEEIETSDDIEWLVRRSLK